jgi:hypothetical protein
MWMRLLKGRGLPPPLQAGVRGSFIIGADQVESLRTFQDDRRLVSWVDTRPGGGRIRLSLGREATVEILDPVARPVRLLREARRMVGRPWIELPPGTALVLIILE